MHPPSTVLQRRTRTGANGLRSSVDGCGRCSFYGWAELAWARAVAVAVAVVAAAGVTGTMVTRLLWKVLWPARSASASEVVQLTLRPSGESCCQPPLGATATPGGTLAETTARRRQEPRALVSSTSPPLKMPRAAASSGLIST